MGQRTSTWIPGCTVLWKNIGLEPWFMSFTSSVHDFSVGVDRWTLCPFSFKLLLLHSKLQLIIQRKYVSLYHRSAFTKCLYNWKHQAKNKLFIRQNSLEQNEGPYSIFVNIYLLLLPVLGSESFHQKPYLEPLQSAHVIPCSFWKYDGGQLTSYRLHLLHFLCLAS